MKNQVDQIKIMSNTLERSGFTEGQPAAIIETVTLAMETFGVTPEILDDRINRVMDFVREQIADVKTERKKQFGELRAQIADVQAEGEKQFGELKAQIADAKAEGKGQVGDVKEQLQDFKAQANSQFEILTAQVTAHSVEIKGIQ